MERTQKIEEALSIVWEEREKRVCGRDELRSKILDKVKEDYLEELLKVGLAAEEKNLIKFTPKGEEMARDIIRRQRLAERILVDVLEIGRQEMASVACEFEHILSEEVEEGICTLLGHPKECPHGHPIPAGDCCAKAQSTIESIVISLTKLSPGEAGRVVYVLTREHPQLHKLMSLGITPGTRISVHQVFPSFVIQVEQTQLALEEDIAKDIYVKRLR